MLLNFMHGLVILNEIVNKFETLSHYYSTKLSFEFFITYTLGMNL